MAERPYPNYWLYRDNKNEWRWTYYASNKKVIAVSSESYKNKADCRHAINLMRNSAEVPIWSPTVDLDDD